jgi:hypothetical protein
MFSIISFNVHFLLLCLIASPLFAFQSLGMKIETHAKFRDENNSLTLIFFLFVVDFIILSQLLVLLFSCMIFRACALCIHVVNKLQIWDCASKS